jgi:hypothetical protein
MQDYSYIGSGKLYMRVFGSAAPLLEVGNVTDLRFKINQDTKKLKDFTKGGGGTFNRVDRIDSVECSFSTSDLSPANLARAVYGSTAAVVSATVTDEPYTAYKNGFIPLANVASAVTAVKHMSGTPTYVLGTDYEVREGGIYILAAGAITDAQVIEITYTKANADVIQALTVTSQEWELVFGGLNEARSGKQVLVEAFRVKLGTADDVGWITEDFNSLNFTGEVIKDTTKTGGASQYFKAQLVQ